MRWFRRRRRIDAGDMHYIEVNAEMLSSPTVVIEVYVQPPVVKAVGTISTPTFPKDVVAIEEAK